MFSMTRLPRKPSSRRRLLSFPRKRESLTLLLLTLFITVTTHAAPPCEGKYCAGKRTYYTDDAYAAQSSLLNIVNRRIAEMFPNFTRWWQRGVEDASAIAGTSARAVLNIPTRRGGTVGDALGGALNMVFGGTMQRNFWEPMDQAIPPGAELGYPGPVDNLLAAPLKYGDELGMAVLGSIGRNNRFGRAIATADTLDEIPAVGGARTKFAHTAADVPYRQRTRDEIRQMINDGDIVYKRSVSPLGDDTKIAIEAFHKGERVGQYTIYRGRNRMEATLGWNGTDWRYRSGGVYSVGMGRYLDEHPEIRYLTSTIINEETVMELDRAWNAGESLVRAFEKTPIGKVRSKWGFTRMSSIKRQVGRTGQAEWVVVSRKPPDAPWR